MPTEKELYFVICTPSSKDDFWNKAQSAKFLFDNQLPSDRYHVFTENRIGLSKIYNLHFTEAHRNEIVVFMHDDLILTHHYASLKRMLNEAHQRYDIVGLAGATRIALTSPTLWHLMAKGMSGSVGHEVNGHSQMSNYGVSPQKCIVVDGLFISVNTDRVIEKKHRFDEQFNFHHYDLDFCIQANEKGLSVGTWPIWLTHMSPGLTSLEKSDWKGSNELFCKKYQIK